MEHEAAGDSLLPDSRDVAMPEGVGGETGYHHHEKHFSNNAQWMRAAVLGACDGVVTIGALITGVASAQPSLKQLLLSAFAGMISGSLSMAVGEYVSVSQQADMAKADIALEEEAQAAGPESRAEELEELTNIYITRGLPLELAKRVAEVLSEKDPVRTHCRDELGIDIDDLPDPWMAAYTSFGYFVCGALLPTLALLLPEGMRFWGVVLAVTLSLALFGWISAYLGGTGQVVGVSRLVIGGWLAMCCTVVVGTLIGGEVPA